MATIHIHRQLSSDTLPELRPLIGKTVDIIVRETDPPLMTAEIDESVEQAMAGGLPDNPLAGSILYYDDPFGPAVPPEEWEANQ